MNQSPFARVDVGLFDLQRRNLISMRTERPIDPDAWSTSVELHHHGSHLGRVFVTAQPDADAERVERTLEFLTPLLALNISAALDFNDKPWTTIRTKEMSLAAEIQATLIPPASCSGGSYLVSAAVEPAYDTGGDVYEYSFDDERLFLAVLDAMGHGLSSSILASLATAALRRSRRENHKLTDMLRQVDDIVRAQHDGTAYVSAVVLDIDLRTGVGEWISAGHLPPLMLSGGRLHEMELVPSLPLGLWITGDEVADDVPIATFTLEPGDTVVLYSDGIVDNLLETSADRVGDDRFRRVVEEEGRMFSHRSARDVVERLLLETGPVLRDDATLLMAHRRPDQSED